MAIHFVGFRNDRIWNAKRIWGEPDFVHRIWDRRAQQEIVDGDETVFAVGDEHRIAVSPSFDDSRHF